MRLQPVFSDRNALIIPDSQFAGAAYGGTSANTISGSFVYHIFTQKAEDLDFIPIGGELAKGQTISKLQNNLSLSPVTFSISGEVLEGWEIIDPIFVTLERDEDGCFILSDDDFLVYGEGRTDEEAQTDYLKSLLDFYYLISDKAAKGDRYSNETLQKLQHHLRQIHS
jgi:hypothetical protein